MPDAAVTVMLVAATPLANFIQRNPTIVMPALAILLLISTALIAQRFGAYVPKGYIYSAMAFSALVEGLNLLSRRARARRGRALEAEQGAMPSLFISYRRDGSAGEAGRLADELEARFDSDRVFGDVDDIPAGEDFTKVIDEALASATTLVVVIGRRWLDAHNQAGQRRLDDPQDFVRLEIESALRQGVPVVPVLVQGAQMPSLEQLPESLRPLALIQAQELSDSRWHYDVGMLMKSLEGRSGFSDRDPRGRRLPAVAGVLLLAQAIGLCTWLTRERPR